MSQYIPQRDTDHVAAGSVASMFSPAAYLAKLWLEAKALHAADNFYGLRTRRPDFEDLYLNQNHLDKKISTLALSNELLANRCKTNGAFASYQALLEALSTYTASSGMGFHQPFETLRGVLARLPDEADLLTEAVIRNLLYAGIAPADRNSLTADEIARHAQIWRLTQFYHQTEEDAGVICGLPLSENESETGGSQFKRLFKEITATALIQMSAVDQRKVLMQAFGLNDNTMTLLQSLSGWDGTTQLTNVTAVSIRYSWLLLSRALGCTLAELVILKNLIDPTNPWQRFGDYQKIFNWLEKINLTTNDLYLMTTTRYPLQSTPQMDSLITEVARSEVSTSESIKNGLANAVASSLGLLSSRQAKALIDWLDTDIPATDINSQRFLTAIKAPISAAMVTYLNRLAQYALVANNLGLTDDMLEMLAKGPTRVPGGNIPSFSLARLENLALLKNIADRCKENAPILLSKIFNGGLKVSDLAQCLRLSVAEMTTDPAATSLDFEQMKSTLNTYGVIKRTGISPTNILSLRTLRASDSYATWKLLAESLLATLPEEQLNSLQQKLDETLSMALSSYQCRFNAPIRYVLIHCPPALARDYFDATELKVMVGGVNVAAKPGVTVSSSTNAWWSGTPKEALIDGNIATRASSGAAVGNNRYWVLVDLNQSYHQINSVEFYTNNATRVANYTLSVLPENSLPALINATTMPDYNSIMQMVGAQHGPWGNLNTSNNQYTLTVRRRLEHADLGSLSHYLLIDPLMGAETQTSRIAWHIASIQQYIERCLNNDEPDVVTSVKEVDFFEQWDRYNKRYRLWAGLARLKYEPENSLDPALRIRQTEAFKNLQVLLNSGQLNEESVEEAFLSYLTEFEQLAELEVMGAYHDTAGTDLGITWFIGRSKGTPYRWYWRSLDHSKVTAGTIPSQVWTGWQQIDLPINLVGNLIKPVVYNSRLHLIWIERQEKTTRNANGVDIAAADSSLKVAYRRFDGSWSTPKESNLTLTGEVLTSFNSKSSLNKLSLFCTEETSRKSILLILNSANKKADLVSGNSNGWFTSSNGSNIACTSTDLTTALTNCKSIIDTYGVDYSFVATPNNGSSEPIAITSIYRNKFFNWSLYSASLVSDFPSRLRNIAAQGIDKIYSPETQQKIDPAIASGFYLNLTFSPESKRQSYLLKVSDGSNTGPIISQGDMIKDKDTEIKCYVPVQEGAIKASVYIELRLSAVFTLDFNKSSDGLWQANFNQSAIANVKKYYVRNSTLEPLEFAGTFGNYYWELFYHVPLLISQCLKQHNEYSTANKWLKYIINLAGIPPLGAHKIRYILLRRKNTSSYLLTSELEAFVNGENIARQASISYGPPLEVSPLNIRDLINGNRTDSVNINQVDVVQGRYYSWVQLDLGASYPIDTIKLWPYTGSQSSIILGNDIGCYIHVSGSDMSSWANGHKEPGSNDIDPLYPLIAVTTTFRIDAIEQMRTYNLRTMIRYWGTLPLQDDDAWDSIGNDVNDPDLIAETDPMHYKLASFMQCLDLLIARGDTAYRQLEPDTLVEAQMWYQQALDALGPEPTNQSADSWTPIVLKDLTNMAVFRPQENEKLSGYWALLRHRLYCLRYNLTIDGLARNLLLYAKPADPRSLLPTATAGTSGIDLLATGVLRQFRFSPALERARQLSDQLTHFGRLLQDVAERQDTEAMNQLLQTQGSQLLDINQEIQQQTLLGLDSAQQSLNIQRDNIQLRKVYYTQVYDENISANEQSALALNATAAALMIAGGTSYLVGSTLDMAPNLFGLAGGGVRWGGVANGIGTQLSNIGHSLSTTAGVLAETDIYRRRREEYKLQLDSTDNELIQLDNQQELLKIQGKAAVMQNNMILTQQRQTGEQLQLLQRKFTNSQLYGWMRSQLSTLFWQFYDLAITASLQAEAAYNWEMTDTIKNFIRPGAWQASYNGLLCGEALTLDLVRMESAWQDKNKRILEVNRTVSLNKLLSSAKTKPKVDGVEVKGVTDAISKLMTGQTALSWDAPVGNGLTYKLIIKDGGLNCIINLAALNIMADYPDNLGLTRRVKSIAVSLPAAIGPYEDIQAILSYDETALFLPDGCKKIALSHGINDSGLFELDFSDPRYLPFEGIKLLKPSEDKGGNLTLSFPNVIGNNKDETQKSIIQSLNDIILHIKYTIRN